MTNKPTTRLSKRMRRGANAIEFALLAPVILTVTFGIMDYGWYFATYSIAQRAAQEGAQVGGQTPLEEDPAGAAKLAAGDMIADNYPANSMVVEYVATVTADSVILDLTLEFDPLSGFVPTPKIIKCSSERLLEEEPDEG